MPRLPHSTLRSALVTLVSALALAAAMSACDREERRFRESPPSATPSGVRLSVLQPGTPQETTHVKNPYGNNAFAVAEGQRLFGWYNCAGCHANGGGSMGPPLMDDEWIYGSSPENIYATIVQGRPNGMPSFAGKIPAPQVWELVAYVRSLSALNTTGARSARSEHMMMYPGSGSLQDPEKPKSNSKPAAGEMP